MPFEPPLSARIQDIGHHGSGKLRSRRAIEQGSIQVYARPGRYNRNNPQSLPIFSVGNRGEHSGVAPIPCDLSIIDDHRYCWLSRCSAWRPQRRCSRSKFPSPPKRPLKTLYPLPNHLICQVEATEPPLTRARPQAVRKWNAGCGNSKHGLPPWRPKLIKKIKKMSSRRQVTRWPTRNRPHLRSRR